MCPRRHCPALPHVLAAHLHPRAAPTSPGLLLVRLTASDTLAKHHQDLPGECLHPLRFHPLPDSHTPDTFRREHTPRHVLLSRADAKPSAQTCRCARWHLPLLFLLSRSHNRFRVAPCYNERPGSPCSIFYGGANAALPSFKPSQGFVSTHLMQIQQIWGYVSESGAEAKAVRQIYTRAGPLRSCSCEK